jgi:hypothetical protein
MASKAINRPSRSAFNDPSRSGAHCSNQRLFRIKMAVDGRQIDFGSRRDRPQRSLGKTLFGKKSLGGVQKALPRVIPTGTRLIQTSV